jgi:hypothetical protein
MPAWLQIESGSVLPKEPLMRSLRCLVIALLVLASIALALVLPNLAQAQVSDCWECVLGIYDDQALTRNFGSWDPTVSPTKDLWFGIKYDPNSGVDRLAGFEFSVMGLGDLLFAVIRPYACDTCPPNTIEAPGDTTTGTGGISEGVIGCSENSRALLLLTLLSFDPAPEDHVLTVLRRFPSTVEGVQSPLIRLCDRPEFTPIRVSGGCYVLNPSDPTPGTVIDGCELVSETTAIQEGNWSHIKALFR